MSQSLNLATVQVALIDAANVVWTINAAGVITINGVPDTTTANVIAIALISGKLWQQNRAGMWWHKTTNPTGSAWLPPHGTATSPFPLAPGAPTGVTAT
jgi:hypothetical protein